MNDLETRLTAALTDTAQRSVPDSLAPPTFRPVPVAEPARGRWLMPVAAAAIVVAVAVGALIGVQRLHHTSSTPPATAPSRVVFHTAGNAELTQDQLQSAVLTMTARLMAAGIPHATVSSLGSDQLVVSGSLTAAQLAALPGVMVAGVLQLRPLLTMPEAVPPRGTPLVAGGQRAVDPWQSLGFTPPSDAAGFAALASDRQSAMLAELKNWDCQNTSANKADTPTVVCDSSGQEVYLLGSPIFGGGQVMQARAAAPGSALGQLQWTVNVDLKPAAQRAWTDFTSKHNEMVAAGAVDNQVADVLDGKVILASTVEETITGGTQIAGFANEASAKSLAAALSTDPLPVSFVQ